MRTDEPDYSGLPDQSYDWERSVHGNVREQIAEEALQEFLQHLLLARLELASSEQVLEGLHYAHQLRDAMRLIAAEGRGVVVLLRDMSMKLDPGDHASPHKLRQYGVGAQILRDLGVRKFKFLTNNPKKIVGLEGFGLEMVEQVPLVVEPNSENERYLRTKQEKMGHLLDVIGEGD